MSKKKTTKKEENVSESEPFDLDKALSNVNQYLLIGFMAYIHDMKITTQKQFDKAYNDYKEFN